MKQLKKILFPTDFSQVAKGAYQYALGLAKHFKAHVKVLNVYRSDFGMPVPEVMAYQMLEARKAEAAKNISLFAKANETIKEVNVETTTEMGLPMDTVVDYSKNHEEAIDLIVMGTKGEHNLAETLLGSVTTSVIHHAHCPVLVVPEGAVFHHIKSIAYATDFKHDNAESLREVASIAALFGAELHCVCVNTKSENINAEMQQFSALVGELDVSAKLAQVGGDSVAYGLDQYVHENGIDLILMLRPKHSFFESIFHSSITKQVAMQVTTPVLVFRK